jgi:hypothetical protein
VVKIVDDIGDEGAVVRNPNRAISKPNIPYEPEYRRLNKTPMEYLPSLDGTSIDSSGNLIPYDNGHFIDNNDFVALPNIPVDVLQTRQPNVQVVTGTTKPLAIQDIAGSGQQPVVSTAGVPTPLTAAKPPSSIPSIGDYILMVGGKIVLTGNILFIENKISQIVYGEDLSFKDVTMEDVVVLKRVNIKVGVFVE